MTVRPGRRVDRLESQRGNHGVLRRSSVVESRGQAPVIPGSDGPALQVSVRHLSLGLGRLQSQRGNHGALRGSSVA